MGVKSVVLFAVVALLALLCSNAAKAVSQTNVISPARDCSVVGPYPGKLTGRFAADSTMRFDLLSNRGALLGRQIVFNGSSSGSVLMSPEAQVLNNNKAPRVKCSTDSEVVLKPQTVVDVGPQVVLHSIYLGRDSVAASFYAYKEDFFAGRKDEGLINQLFSVSLDGHAPCEVQVTAKPGQAITVRFEGVAPGPHHLQFGEMEMGGPQMRYYSTGLYELDFIQPKVVSALH